jgi:16S rRNA (guanine966-N2)-methyltransferase
VFVERDRVAAAVLARNIDAVGLGGTQLLRRPVMSVLAGSDEPFDLVFADPPYELPDDELAAILAALVEPGWLTADAIVVVERSARGAEPPWPDGIALVTQRRYGEGLLWYGRRQS